MSLPKDQAWFAAKRYGYGWGFPTRWQGWLMLVAYLAAISIASFRFVPKQLAEFVICLVVLTLALLAVCAWKGEAPKWRWGDKPDDTK